MRSIGETYTGGEVVPPGWRQRTRHTWVTRKQPATRRTGEDHRLHSWYEGLNFVELFVPGSAYVVTKTVVQGQVRFHSPTVLRVQAKIKVSAVRGIRLPLYKGRGRAQQKIHEVAAGFTLPAAVVRAKKEVAVGDVGKVLLQLVVVILPAKLNGVGTDYFAEVVNDLVDVVNQLVRTAGHANYEIVEINFGHALHSRIAHENPGLVIQPRGKTQSRQRLPGSAQRMVERGIQPEVADAKFIYCRAAECLRVVDAEIVSTAAAVHGEARHQRSVTRPVRVNAVVAVGVVVTRNQAKPGVGVQAAAEFVVAQVDFSRIGGKSTRTRGRIHRARSGRLNVLQKLG